MKGRFKQVIGYNSQGAVPHECFWQEVRDGSNPSDIFGGDIVIDNRETMKNHIVWEAHPNIEQNRLLGIGHGRPLTDEGIIDELKCILIEWIY